MPGYLCTTQGSTHYHTNYPTDVADVTLGVIGHWLGSQKEGGGATTPA